MKPQKADPIRLELPIHDLPSEPLEVGSVIAMVQSFASTRVRCRKHGKPVGDIGVSLAAGVATIDVTPCCSRAAKDLATHLRRLKGVGDDRRPDAVRPGQHFVRPASAVAAAPTSLPMPSLPFAGSRSTGRRAVSAQVAAQFEQAGRLQHIARVNDERVDVYSSESADEEMFAQSMADGKVPPCTAENIRIRTKKLIAAATSLALKEGRPLSDYACIVDWDAQVMRVEPARDTRELFVGAGDVPFLVEELDANSGETLLVFLFANDRYDRTMRVTSRGYVVGKEGEA